MWYRIYFQSAVHNTRSLWERIGKTCVCTTTTTTTTYYDDYTNNCYRFRSSCFFRTRSYEKRSTWQKCSRRLSSFARFIFDGWFSSRHTFSPRPIRRVGCGISEKQHDDTHNVSLKMNKREEENNCRSAGWAYYYYCYYSVLGLLLRLATHKIAVIYLSFLTAVWRGYARDAHYTRYMILFADHRPPNGHNFCCCYYKYDIYDKKKIPMATVENVCVVCARKERVQHNNVYLGNYHPECRSTPFGPSGGSSVSSTTI